jgi:hypothetical protein
MENLKIQTVVYTDGVKEEEAKRRVENPFTVRRKTNYKKPSAFLGLEFDQPDRGKLYDLKIKIQEYRNFLVAVLNSGYFSKKYSIEYLSILNVGDIQSKSEGSNSWEMFYFYHVPLSGVLAELTRWQCVIRESENEVLSSLWADISITTFKFDAVSAAIIPGSTIVESGSVFEAEVFMQAYSYHVLPNIYYGPTVDTTSGRVTGGTRLKKEDFTIDGRGHIKIPAGSVGEKKIEGVIEIVHPSTGALAFYPFKTTYTVVSKK